MTEAADYLARMAEDWTREPFQAISNEGQAGAEFLGHLTAVLTEREQLHAALDAIRLVADVLHAAAGSPDLANVAVVARLLGTAIQRHAEQHEVALPGLGLNDTEAS